MTGNLRTGEGLASAVDGVKTVMHCASDNKGDVQAARRVTQFYEFVLEGAQKASRLPIVPVPARFWVQPVDTRDVAVRLTELALAAPAGRVPDLAGPQVATADDMIRAYLRARGRRRPVLPVRMPGTAQIRSGALLPSSDGRAAGAVNGQRTWEEFLAQQLQTDR